MRNRKISRRIIGTADSRPAPKLKISRRQVGSGGMTVREAGRLGGLIGGRKGGLAVKKERGIEFYQEIGRLGGERVRALIAAGRKATLRRRRVRRQHR
jgi:general stress protein YciG